MKRLLVVVDYQNDFVDGPQGFPEAEKLERPIGEKIAAYHETGDEVAFMFDTHRRCSFFTQEGCSLPTGCCVEGTSGHDLHGEVAFLARDIDAMFHSSTLGSADFFERCRQAQRAADEVGKPPFESIEFVGLMSNACVLANAVLARTACPEVPVIVDAACTASHDPVLNEKALDLMEGMHIDVVNRSTASSVPA